MDDVRLWLQSIRLGWRWEDGQLCYRQEWRDEERRNGMTGLDKSLLVKHCHQEGERHAKENDEHQ